MKAIKLSTLILFLGTIAWLCFQSYKISNNEVGFEEFTQIPIAIAFLISLLLFRLNLKGISFLLFALSTLILILGLFSLISNEILFKTESILLLFFGAYTLFSLSKVNSKLSLIVYFGTAVLFSLPLLLETSSEILQFIQIGFGILTSALAIISSFKSSN